MLYPVPTLDDCVRLFTVPFNLKTSASGVPLSSRKGKEGGNVQPQLFIIHDKRRGQPSQTGVLQ